MMNIKVIGIVFVLSMLVPTLDAHIQIHSPNGGETLDVGSVFTIEWEVLIEHATENWDIWYSTTGPTGPWIEVAMDLPTGDPTAGSIHTYDWTIPEDISDQARVRVRQDNLGMKAVDISDKDFSISYLAFGSDPDPVSGGEILTLTTQATSLPDTITALTLVNVNGIPPYCMDTLS
jgi:hypothetical protein